MADRHRRRSLPAAILGLLLVAGGAAADDRPAQLELPDVTLVDQDGVSRRLLKDLVRGRIAVVSFVFTGCTTICSPVGANMGALDRLLGTRTAREVSLFSVTLDPYNDTPAQLAKWRAKFDDAPGWRLLTGEPADVEALLHAMQADPAGIANHDGFLWVGDPKTGTWRRVSAFAEPKALAQVIDQLAAAL